MSGQSSDARNVGSRETLESLANEFRYNTSFGEKVRELLAMGYTEWRRIRGDGNCFYRSVGYGWLEEIVQAPGRQQRAWAQDMLRKLRALHFDSRADQAAHKRLVAHVSHLADGRGWQEISRASQNGRPQQELLEASFMENDLDLALVRALRTLIGQYLMANADDDTVCNGISFRVLCAAQGQGSPEDFCRTTVLRMGVEAETQILRATVQALRIRLQIVLLDRAADTKLCFENYDVIGGEGEERPSLHVQIRPGHYDLIYQTTPGPQLRERDNDASEEYQRYFCRECAYPFLWQQTDKPNVRCEKCGHSICVLCLTEASRPRSVLEVATGLPRLFSKALKPSGELLCPHVAAQLEVNDIQLTSLQVQLQQEGEDWAGAVAGLEEQFQDQRHATEQAEARAQDALDRGRTLAQRCQGLEQTNEELLQESQRLEGRCHGLEEEVARQTQQLEGQVRQFNSARCKLQCLCFLCMMVFLLLVLAIWHGSHVTRVVMLFQFQPVDGGSGRACRGNSTSDFSSSYFKHTKTTSLDGCMVECVKDPLCKGIEHGPDGMCEVWTRSEGIQASIALADHTCLSYGPVSTSMSASAAATQFIIA